MVCSSVLGRQLGRVDNFYGGVEGERIFTCSTAVRGVQLTYQVGRARSRYVEVCIVNFGEWITVMRSVIDAALFFRLLFRSVNSAPRELQD